MQDLRKHIIDYFLAQQDHYDLFIPYDAGDAHARVRANANIVKSGSHEQGMFYRIRIPDFIFAQLGLGPYVLAPEQQKWEEQIES
jgi:GTP-binding protein HflX